MKGDCRTFKQLDRILWLGLRPPTMSLPITQVLSLLTLSVLLIGDSRAATLSGPDGQIKTRGGRHTTVFTKVGENVTLPCDLGPSNLKSTVVDWKKDSKEVFFDQPGMSDYTNGREGQDREFKGRVRWAGNASVILSHVKETDIGVYKCTLLPKEQTSWVHLKMVEDPELTLTIEEDRLSCVSQGGLPQPRGLLLQYQDGAEVGATKSTNSSDRDSLRLNQRVTKPGNYTCLALRGNVNPARVTRPYFGNQQSSAITLIICVIYVVGAIVIVVYIKLFEH